MWVLVIKNYNALTIQPFYASKSFRDTNFSIFLETTSYCRSIFDNSSAAHLHSGNDESKSNAPVR